MLSQWFRLRVPPKMFIVSLNGFETFFLLLSIAIRGAAVEYPSDSGDGFLCRSVNKRMPNLCARGIV